jgi:signal transduction histidine kinase
MPRDPEFAELARAFNSMAAELARQEDLRRGMVADIAHELRTPLSVLHLKVESFEDGIETPNEQSLLALQGQIAILTRLVDDLRLLSLADAGQLSLSLQPVDARAAIEQAAHAAHDHARQRGVELRLAPANDLPPICADPQRLAQILGNLLENALRYTPPGGSVTLSAASAHDSVTFAVSDTGPGIPTEDLPQIFNRFYRTDRARARETGGSGLGLAIVQRLVEAQNGTIDVTSAPGHGTTFRVALPTASKR